MANKIIQWNLRGMKANYNELLLLIMGICPAVVCLQETFLKETDNININNFTSYNYINTNNERASGGTSVIVNNRVPQSEIDLNTKLQAIAVSVTLHRTITICSIYIPPNDNINETELDNLLQQLPKPYILMGDFNSHNELWGCRDTNSKGRNMESFINRNNICLYNNNKTNTYLSPASGTYSAIDLTMSDPTVFLDYSWRAHEDTCGSDHFPLILENSGPCLDERVPNWNLKRANWDEFQRLCTLKLTPDCNTNTDKITFFTNTLLSIANETIPKTSTSSKYNKPWYNEDCKRAIRSRRAALRKFRLQPTAENLDLFKIRRA